MTSWLGERFAVVVGSKCSVMKSERRDTGEGERHEEEQQPLFLLLVLFMERVFVFPSSNHQERRFFVHCIFFWKK